MPDRVRGRFKTTHVIAVCKGCDWRSEDHRAAERRATEHAAATGHVVRIERAQWRDIMPPGRCCECGASTTGKSQRCERHKAARKAAHSREYGPQYHRDHGRLRRKLRGLM